MSGRHEGTEARRHEGQAERIGLHVIGTLLPEGMTWESGGRFHVEYARRSYNKAGKAIEGTGYLYAIETGDDPWAVAAACVRSALKFRAWCRRQAEACPHNAPLFRQNEQGATV